MNTRLATADLSAEFTSIRDVIDGLTRVEAHCQSNEDLRGAFATAYLHITRAIESAQKSGRFADPAWVERYLICFGNLYRRALIAYEEDRVDAVPKCWRFAFDAARTNTGFVIQHLTLGINAHINHDLALALSEIGIDPNREARYADHTLVNEILADATHTMKQAVAESYAPILLRLDRLAGRYGEDLPNFSIPKAREHAWAMAVALANTANDLERRHVATALDEQATVLARLILASPTQHRLVVEGVDVAKQVDGRLRWLAGLPLVGRFFRR